MTSTIDRGELEFFGPVKVRHTQLDVSNYDDDAAGDGELLQASDVGFYRIMHVRVESVDSADATTASFDASVGTDGKEGAVRLFYQANDGNGTANDPLTEVTSNTNATATLQLAVFGK